MDENEFEPNEDMDGDFDSAMASAGLGTDEDYGTPASKMLGAPGEEPGSD